MRYLIAIIATCWAQMTWAGHPLITDDTGTQGEGGQQIELNTDRQRTRDFSARTAAFTYTYGLRDGLDVFAGVPFQLSSPAGAGDLEVGVKWTALESGASSAGVRAALTLPSGDEYRGLGSGKPNAALILLASHDAAPWQLLGNLAITSNRFRLEEDREANRSVLWRVSGAVVYTLNERWNLIADTGIRRAAEVDNHRDPVFLVLGAIFSPQPDIDLDAGVTLHRRCDSCEGTGRLQFGIGFTRRF